MTAEESVAALLDKMAEENERRRWWMRELPKSDGRLVMRNCATGEVVTITLPRPPQPAAQQRARGR
jgi:hypothetical protein